MITMMTRMISAIRSSPNQEEKKDNNEDAPPEPDCCCTTVMGVGDGVEVGSEGVLTGGRVGSWTLILSPPPLVAFTPTLGLGVACAAAGVAASTSCTLSITITAHTATARLPSISNHQLTSAGGEAEYHSALSA